ncbi:MAG: TIR domain-containing protein [Acidobacteriota bacterium]
MMRVFMSYGRADAQELAARLATDLAGRSHIVWLDSRAITAGRSWEEQIEGAIMGCDVFVALLSPHAVRRPDGVCLDEISLARYNGRRIIPVMVLQCRPPLGIYRLDWIDFQDWTAAGRYERALQRLLDSLAASAPSIEGVTAAPLARLRPLDFGAELARLARGFTGRDWLLAELSTWLADNGSSRVFLITGDPGTGKSAIVAWLVEHHPRVAAYHLCAASLADSLDPVRFVRSIAAQLRTQLPGYRTALEALDLDALADGDPGSLLRRVVLDPLRAELQHETLILAVDALDEGMAYGSRHIARLLAERLEDLPTWLRLVLSTRKEPQILDLFSRFRPHEIDAARTENLEDIRVYLSRRLAEPALAERLRGAGADAAALATRIATGGSGNFLYVTQAVAAVESGQIDPSAVSAFPEGLVGIYQGFFARAFPEGRGYDAIRPLLEVLTAAREPLSAEQVARFLDRSPFAVASDLEQLAAFFPERDGRYRPFHKSIADWLSGVAGRSRRYRVDRAAGDRRIGERLLADFGHGRCDPYALSHLLAHLLSADLRDEAVSLLGDLEFLEAKCAAGLAFALVADFNAALARPDWPESARARLAAFARFIQSRSHILAIRPNLLFSMAANEPDDSPLAVAARERTRCGRERRPWVRWLNKPQAGHSALVMRFLGSMGFLSCALSPDGRIIAAGTDSGHLLLWDAETGALLHEHRQHTGGITACAFFPDGRRLVTASNDSTLRIWDLDTGPAGRTLWSHARQVNACAVSPDGHRIASAGEEGRLVIWDSATSEIICDVSPRDMGLYACAFSPDGRRIACGGRLHQVVILQAGSGHELARLTGHEGEVKACTFSRDGRRLLTAAADETLRVWNLDSGDALRIATGHTGGVNACVFLNDERWILSAGSWDARLKVWDSGSGEELATLRGHSFWVSACAAHPDGRRAVSASTDMTVCLWDIAAAVRAAHTTAPVRSSPLLGAHKGHACGVQFLAGGTRLVTASWDGTIRIWDTLTEKLLATLPAADRGTVEDGAATHEGGRLATAGEEGLIRGGDSKKVYGAAITPDGKRLVSASEDGALRVWDLRKYQEEWTWQDVTCPVRACAISPDGAWVASGSDDGIVRIRAIEQGAEARELRGHQSWITTLRYAPDGRSLVSGSYDGTLRIWDVASGAERFRLINKREPVFASAISPDGARVAAVSAVEATHQRDVMLRTWEIETGRLRLETLKKVLALDLAFSPDGRWLAFAGFDRHLKILDPEDGREVAEHRSETKPCSVAWHPGGRRLAAGCINGDVHIVEIENM